jgi:Fur family ferric uptake transcriptional regulator
VLEGTGELEYIICDSCGALKSFDPSALAGVRDEVREQFGFEVRFSHFPMVGLCEGCARTRRDRV